MPISEARSIWKTKRFRLLVVGLVGAILALLAGETSLGAFVKDNWEAIGALVGMLWGLFTVHGQTRLEKHNADLAARVAEVGAAVVSNGKGTG